MGLLMDMNVDITEGAQTYSPIIHQPFEQFSPSYQIDSTYAPSIFIDSPQSTGAVVTTKKQATQTPTIEGADVTAPTTGSPPDITGTILMVAIVGVIGYVIVTMVKKKKRKK